MASLSMFFHTRIRYLKSAVSMVLVAFFPAVRTIMPNPSGIFKDFKIPTSRFLSSSSVIFLETPLVVLPGMSTPNRPGREIKVVSMAPFWLMGSLVTWTIISCPFLIRLNRDLFLVSTSRK